MTDTLDEAYRQFFIVFDKVAPASGIAFADEAGKEWIETYLLRALDRVGAARYHIGQAKKHEENLAKLRKDAEERLSTGGATTGHRDTKTFAQVILPCREMVYECDAFLSAARSSIDFVASAAARFIKGMSDGVRSVTSLWKWTERAESVSLAQHFSDWRPWIEEIKKYRDTCSHYRTLRGLTGYRASKQGMATTSTTIPFVIPEKPGKDVPDTRRRRAQLEEIPPGLEMVTEMGEVVHADGGMETFHFREEFIPASGYLTVVDFCQRHLEKLECFIAGALNELRATGYQLQHS